MATQSNDLPFKIEDRGKVGNFRCRCLKFNKCHRIGFQKSERPAGSLLVAVDVCSAPNDVPYQVYDPGEVSSYAAVDANDIRN